MIYGRIETFLKGSVGGLYTVVSVKQQETGCGYKDCSEQIKALLDAASQTERARQRTVVLSSDGECEGGLLPFLSFQVLRQGRVIITERTSQGLVLSNRQMNCISTAVEISCTLLYTKKYHFNSLLIKFII